MPASGAPAARGAIGGRPFAMLARAYAASLAGDAFVAVALAGSLFFAVPSEAARPKVALYLLVTMTPFALVAPVLGPALDRAKTRRVAAAVAVTLGRAVLCLLMARHYESLLFYPEAFGSLVLMKGFQVIKSALVPAVVTGRDDLVRANARLTLVGVIGGAVAGAFAVGILQLGGSAWVLLAGAVVYVVAAVAVTRVSSATASEVAASRTERRRPADLLPIRLASIAMATVRAGVGFLTFLLAFSLKREGEPAWFYGVVIGVSAAGGFAGALAAPRLRRRLREEAVLVVSLALPAATAVMGARSDARTAALTVAFALGLGSSAGRAGFDSLVQRDAAESEWGRSFARYEAYFQLAWVLGAAVPVIATISPGFGLIVLGLGLGAGVVVYLAGMAADSLIHARP